MTDETFGNGFLDNDLYVVVCEFTTIEEIHQEIKRILDSISSDHVEGDVA